MTNPAAFEYGLFVAYAYADRAWVEGFLLDGLRSAGVRLLTQADFEPGVPWTVELERAAAQSPRVLLVLSRAYLADDRQRLLDGLARYHELKTEAASVIPLLLEEIELPLGLEAKVSLRAVTDEERTQAVERLARACRAGPPTDADRLACPYPGMAAFDRRNAALFHGRRREVEDLLQDLRHRRCLFLIGRSGSGKSSLALAGLLPRLEEGRTVHVMRPGATPAATLAALTSGGGGRRLLVIDQFEEVYTRSEAGEASRFQEALVSWLEAPEQVLLATVRSDFYPDLQGSPAVFPLFQANHRDVLPLGPEGLREAIVAPASQAGVFVEPALVERLLADAAGEPGVLPHLQETMQLLWERRRRRYLSLEAYQELGRQARTGLQQAMAAAADAAVDTLRPEEQALARRTLLRLVQFGEGREDSRRQQPLAALESAGDPPGAFERVLARLILRRLVVPDRVRVGTTDATVLDLAHEALITGWPRLQGWVREAREAEQTRRRLEGSAAEWVRRGRAEGGLLDEVELREAEAWLAESGGEMGASADLRALVGASQAAGQAKRKAEVEAREQRVRAAEELAEVQRRRAEERAQAAVKLRRRLAGALLVGALALAGAVAAVLLWVESREANRRRVRAQVDQLGTASPEDLPSLLAALKEERREVLPRLRQLWADEGADPQNQKRMRAGLALLVADPEAVQAPWLADLLTYLLKAEHPREVVVVRDVLAPWGNDRRAELWKKVVPATSGRERLRAAVALARFDPDDPRWAKAGADVVGPWLESDLLYLGLWTEALLPVRRHLVGPLTDVFHGKRATLADKRQAAASVLAGYLQDDPEKFADLLADAEEAQFGALLRKLPRHSERAVKCLRDELHRQAAPAATSPQQLAQRQANAAAALLLLKEPGDGWLLFRHREDPTARSYLVQRAAPLGVPAELLVERLLKEPDVSARRALILSLGEFGPEQLRANLRQRLVPKLLDWYRDDPDPGIHAAVDWLLRHGHEGEAPRKFDWSQRAALERIDGELAVQARAPRAAGAAGALGLLAFPPGGGALLAAGVPLPGAPRPDGRRRWYVNGQGQTLALFLNPPPFRMGSPKCELGHFEHEQLHLRRVGRNFALGTRPVTVAEFERFRTACPEVRRHNKEFTQEPHGPIVTVTWYAAAAYCRWLSEQEGVPEHQMCFPSLAEITRCQEGKAPLSLPADYLARTGYRLPSEVEWEYACRAGTLTSRFYGSSEELLPRYAWYLHNAGNRACPVGQKRPNDFGLFDMHGNVWQWCMESYRPYPAGPRDEAAGDEEDQNVIDSNTIRVLRGASFYNPATVVRAAFRYEYRPGIRVDTFGLRVARTCP
jgi:formylglycine-generating enzyme required for sulfatase activity